MSEKASLPQTLPQWLLYRATQQPRDVGQRHKRDGIWREYTWQDIWQEVREIAYGLLSSGVKRGQTVLLIGENRPEMYWGEWAAMCIGAKTVSLYPDATEVEVEYVVQDSQAVCIFAEDQEQVDKIIPIAQRHVQVQTIVWWEPGGLWNYKDKVLSSWAALQVAGEPLRASHPQLVEEEIAKGTGEDIALLSYTSGTTGKPKGVISTHRWLLHNAQMLSDSLKVNTHCEYLSYLPLAWATEQWVGVTLGLIRPMRINFAEQPDQIQEAIREIACELVFFGPRQWESLAAKVHARMLDVAPWRRRLVEWGMNLGQRVRAPRSNEVPARWMEHMLLPLAELLVLRPLREQLGLKRTRIAMNGGAAAAPDIFRLFAGIGVLLRAAYGCSEFGVISVHGDATVDPETIGSTVLASTPWGPGVAWRISAEGELQVREGSGFSGYWGMPEKTAEKWDGEWFRTGDAVGLAEDGRQLIYYDRVDHMSTLANGARFSKQFIEVRLRFSPYIKEVMVIGDENRDGVTALINIDSEVFGRWAEHHGVSFTTFTDLSQREEIIEQVAQAIESVNRQLPAQARVQHFANFPKELDPDEGELTRTRKLKRDFIEERYRAIIEAMYVGHDQASLEIPVRYQDGTTGVLNAQVKIRSLSNAGKESAA